MEDFKFTLFCLGEWLLVLCVFVTSFFSSTRSHYVGQAALELSLCSLGYPQTQGSPASASRVLWSRWQPRGCLFLRSESYSSGRQGPWEERMLPLSHLTRHCGHVTQEAAMHLQQKPDNSTAGPTVENPSPFPLVTLSGCRHIPFFCDTLSSPPAHC